MKGVGLRERRRYCGAWSSASEFCMISRWAKVTTRKVRNWARSVTGSGQESGFSRCGVQGGIWSTESAHFDGEFELKNTCKSGHVS